MKWLIPVLLLLAGCTPEPRVEIRTVTETVEIPVSTPCVNASDVPPPRQLETDSLVTDDSLFDKARAMSIDLLGLKADDKQLRALIVGCAE